MKLIVKIGLVFFCIILFGPLYSKDVEKPPNPIVVSEQAWEFGVIPKDSWVSHHYLLTNTAKDTITINEFVPGCDCTHVPRGSVKIAPGETYSLNVLFDTRTYFGETNREVQVLTDFAPNPEFSLYFMSIVARPAKAVTIKPPSTVFITGINQQVLSVKNNDAEDLHFKVLLDHDSALATTPEEFDLAAGDSKGLTIKPFWDKFSKGSHYSCLTLMVTGPKGAMNITVPVKINNF